MEAFPFAKTKVGPSSKWCRLLSLTTTVWHARYTYSQTGSKKYYRDNLCHLCDVVRHKRPDFVPSSWECSSRFLAHVQTFLGKNQDGYASAGSLRSWYGPLFLLVVPQTQEAIERKRISHEREHYGSNYRWAKFHTKTGNFGMLPTMAAQLEEVCEIPTELLWG